MTGKFLWSLGAVLVLGSLALRWPALDLSLWVDEAGSLAQASAADFWAAARHDVHPPLYYLLLRGELFFTASIPLLRSVSAGCGVALALLAAWSFRASRAGAVTAGVLAAAAPELLHHSVQLRPYALLSLLLGLALALARKIAHGRDERRARIALALVLLAAAATHLTTVFFLLALIPLVGWPERRAGAKAWLRSLWPLAPALLLLLWFKFAFVTQPRDLPEGWWIQPIGVSDVLAAFREATGWDNIAWLGEALARHKLLPSWLVPAGAAVLVIVSFAAAGRSRSDTFRWLLLGAAVIYWTALCIYSVLFEPIVLARTILPGLLPFFAWLAWGIGRQSRRGWRAAGVAATLGYSVLAVAQPVREMQLPSPGLRGLARQLQATCQPGDLVVALRDVEVGLKPYWPELSAPQLLRVELARPLAPQLGALAAHLQALSHSARVWVVYRDDFYFQRDQSAFERVRSSLKHQGLQVRMEWQSADLTLLCAERLPR